MLDNLFDALAVGLTFLAVAGASAYLALTLHDRGRDAFVSWLAFVGIVGAVSGPLVLGGDVAHNVWMDHCRHHCSLIQSALPSHHAWIAGIAAVGVVRVNPPLGRWFVLLALLTGAMLVVANDHKLSDVVATDLFLLLGVGVAMSTFRFAVSPIHRALPGSFLAEQAEDRVRRAAGR